MKSNTIAAIATPMTNSGIGIIRISGDEALDIIEKVFKPKKKDKKIKEVKTYTAHYGHVYDGDTLLDECIVLVMKGPHSYTAEDVVEINCHGGVVVMKKVLEAVFKAGAAPAEPGEFTKRAFLNGRIDLSEAEAVMDLIQSKNEFAMSTSLKQLEGVLGKKITEIRKQIIHSVAFIESALDDPEHYSVDGFSDELKEQVEKIIRQLNEFLENADNGRILKEGIQTVIVGKPNAGKSSVLNVLLGEERAIVTDIAGTTRDTLEESIQIKGIPLNIIDTAGIRQTEDVVEKIGVKKAIGFAEEADLIIYVVDSSTEMDQNDENIIRMIRDKKVIVLMNKSDLKPVVSCSDIEQHLQAPIIEISAREETGLDAFENTLKDMFFAGDIHYNDELCITNVRHKAAITAALESLKMVMNSINDGMPEDFFSIDLMDAYEQLGHIIGEAVEDDLVDTIFSDFCMGK